MAGFWWRYACYMKHLTSNQFPTCRNIDMGPAGPWTKNECAGEGQQQFHRPTTRIISGPVSRFRNILHYESFSYKNGISSNIHSSRSEWFAYCFWSFELSDYGFEFHSAYERMSPVLCVVLPVVDIEVLCFNFIGQRFFLMPVKGS
jgi:hypothetical protein